MDDAARSLGLGQGATLRRVHLPILRGSLFTACLLVFVDVMKELPATLVMRPFDFDTLATQAYTLASDERLAEAASVSLAIVAVGLLPLIACRARSRAAALTPAAVAGDAARRSAIAGAVENHLRLGAVHRQRADRQAVGLELAEGFERRIGHLDAGHHRPFVVAVGKIALRLVARQVLQELTAASRAARSSGRRRRKR
jgi:hypothetical protein